MRHKRLKLPRFFWLLINEIKPRTIRGRWRRWRNRKKNVFYIGPPDRKWPTNKG